jgi:hypothetical protein
MSGHVPPRITLVGQKDKAAQLIGLARSQMAILDKQLSFQGLQTGKRVMSPFYGVTISCERNYAHTSYIIDVMPSAKLPKVVHDEPEEKKPERVSFLIFVHTARLIKIAYAIAEEADICDQLQVLPVIACGVVDAYTGVLISSMATKTDVIPVYAGTEPCRGLEDIDGESKNVLPFYVSLFAGENQTEVLLPSYIERPLTLTVDGTPRLVGRTEIVPAPPFRPIDGVFSWQYTHDISLQSYFTPWSQIEFNLGVYRSEYPMAPATKIVRHTISELCNQTFEEAAYTDASNHSFVYHFSDTGSYVHQANPSVQYCTKLAHWMFDLSSGYSRYFAATTIFGEAINAQIAWQVGNDLKVFLPTGLHPGIPYDEIEIGGFFIGGPLDRFRTFKYSDVTLITDFISANLTVINSRFDEYTADSMEYYGAFHRFLGCTKITGLPGLTETNELSRSIALIYKTAIEATGGEAYVVTDGAPEGCTLPVIPSQINSNHIVGWAGFNGATVTDGPGSVWSSPVLHTVISACLIKEEM